MIGPTALCPNGIALAFFDLDNTILVDGAVLSPRVLDAINLSRERGCMACVSTGRAIHMVPELLTKPEAMDYLVCANGAFVHDTFGDTLYEHLMTREQVLAAMDALTPLGAAWNAFVKGRSYFEWRSLSYMVTGHRQPPTPQTVRKSLHTGGSWRQLRRAVRFAKRIVTKRDNMQQVRRVRPVIEKVEGGISKIGCTLPTREACERAMVALDHLGEYEVARVSGTELEITAKGTTKATAARWLMDYLGIDPSCTVAFGDSENDAPLIEACGTFVAMENGDGHIKEIADDVCESMYDDGVARWLERAMAEADGAKHV